MFMFAARRLLRLPRVLFAMLLAVTLAGCSAAAAPGLPLDAPGVTAPAEYAFGSAVQSTDWHAASRVLDVLEARFGAKSMRMLTRTLPDDADPAAVEAHYRAALPGWTEFSLGADVRGKSWSFALVSPDGRSVFAVVALTPKAAGQVGIVPMTVFTNVD